MQYQFDEEKATQAAAYLIGKYDGSLNHMKMIKMLYIANRISLQECGEPIVPDVYVSMPHGPVLSCLLDRINEPAEDVSQSYWDTHIRQSAPRELQIVKDPGYGKLSRRALRILDSVDQKWHDKDQFAIRNWTHMKANVPEWTDPQGSSRRIKPRDLFQAIGRTAAEAATMEKEEEIYQREARRLKKVETSSAGVLSRN